MFDRICAAKSFSTSLFLYLLFQIFSSVSKAPSYLSIVLTNTRAPLCYFIFAQIMHRSFGFLGSQGLLAAFWAAHEYAKHLGFCTHLSCDIAFRSYYLVRVRCLFVSLLVALTAQ